MTPIFLYSPRLLFVAGSPDLLIAELQSTSALAKMLNVTIPTDWPPGEYDKDAQEFFLSQLSKEGSAGPGWYSWYVILYPSTDRRATLVASAGYFGPPDNTGTVEIGYSVSEQWRRYGIATELIGVIANHALGLEHVKRVIAHVRPDNHASGKALLKNGFYTVESADPEKNCFELVRSSNKNQTE